MIVVRIEYLGVYESVTGLPDWLVFGLAMGIAFTIFATGVFAVATRLFPNPARARAGISGDGRRRDEIRAYLDSIGERFAEDHPVAGQTVAFFLPERAVAITFDARAFFRIENAGVHAVLVEHELPGGALGARLPFETPTPADTAGSRRTGATTGTARSRSAGWSEELRPARDPVAHAFELLDLDENASLEEIKAAYREKVKAVHPDQGGDPEQFQRVREAYTIAKDVAR